MAERLYCGVDGGTGDMEAVLVDVRGTIRGTGTSGPSNDPEIVGRMHPRVGEHVVEAISGALRAARAESSDIRALSLNLSGDPNELTLERARKWLDPLHLDADTAVAIDQDGLSAWAAAGFPDPSIWILVGTNCGAEGLRDGVRFRHPLANLDLDAHLGRAVGGASIGSWGLGLAIRSQLGDDPTGLFQAFEAALDVRGVDEMIDWAAAHTTSDERAELFRVVTEVAAAGDRVADGLLRGAARDLATATRALAQHMRLDLGSEPFTLVLAGKAWRAEGALLDEFRINVEATIPSAVVLVNQVSQAQGAALLAMRQAGIAAR